MKIRSLTATESTTLRRALQALSPAAGGDMLQWAAYIMLQKEKELQGKDFIDKLLWIEDSNDNNSQG